MNTEYIDCKEFQDKINLIDSDIDDFFDASLDIISAIDDLKLGWDDDNSDDYFNKWKENYESIRACCTKKGIKDYVNYCKELIDKLEKVDQEYANRSLK